MTWPARLLLALTVPVIGSAACSSDEEVANPREPSGSGGKSSGGASGAAQAGATGTGATAGAGGEQAVCPRYCDTITSTSCITPVDPASCLTFCQQIVDVTTQAGCGVETEAVLDCYADYPAAQYTCDANGNPVSPVAECQASNDTLDLCLCQSACSAAGTAGCPAFDQAGCEQVCAGLRDGCLACRNDYTAILVCTAIQPATAFQCNAQGTAEHKPETCTEQITTWQSCTAAACPQA